MGRGKKALPSSTFDMSHFISFTPERPGTNQTQPGKRASILRLTKLYHFHISELKEELESKRREAYALPKSNMLFGK